MKKETKSMTKRVRLNESHLKALNIILPVFDNNFSKFVKFHILNKFDYEQNTPIKDTNIKGDILKQLGKMGNNLNQTTRFLNSNKESLNSISLNKIQNQMVAIEKEMIEIRIKLIADDN